MEEATAGELLVNELVLFLIVGAPVGTVCWIWAEQLAELFAHRSAPADSHIKIKRGTSPITGRASHWEDAVADERYKNDAKVIRWAMAILLGVWSLRLIWKAVAVII